jgi:hypothetical protein
MPELINTVFRGSGLLAGEDAVTARRFRHPEPSWLHDNYFHDPSEDDWIPALAGLVVRRRAGALPARPPLGRRGGALRDAWERKRALGSFDRSAIGYVALAVGIPIVGAVRVVRPAAGRAPRQAGRVRTR